MAKTKAAKGKRRKRSCPDTPKEFFTEVHTKFIEWVIWASEVDDCWDSNCGKEDDLKRGLDKVCKELMKWWENAKDWGDDVEDCFKSQCRSQPPGHTTPPDPPFGS